MKTTGWNSSIPKDRIYRKTLYNWRIKCHPSSECLCSSLCKTPEVVMRRSERCAAQTLMLILILYCIEACHWR
jgi:hypothetical protein